MLRRPQVEWVERLAAQGLSQRAISRVTGLARATVGRIVRGERPAADDRRRTAGLDDQLLFHGPIERCPLCGARVYAPCLACRVRRGG